jgi:PqqD family protein of HPr-rel-A system
MSTEIRWSADADLRQHWRAWDGEVMVYHAGSGGTLCFNALAARVLEILSEKAMTRAELMPLLRVGSEAGPGAQEIDALLRQFDDLGLISPHT